MVSQHELGFGFDSWLPQLLPFIGTLSGCFSRGVALPLLSRHENTRTYKPCAQVGRSLLFQFSSGGAVKCPVPTPFWCGWESSPVAGPIVDGRLLQFELTKTLCL